MFHIFNKGNDDLYSEFSTWLTGACNVSFPTNTKAINFNLYDDGNNKWSVELVGTSNFDINDQDWACDEVFSTRDAPFQFISKKEWNEILMLVSDYIRHYLDENNYGKKLKIYEGIGIGFVDGDIVILYKK